MAMKRKRMEIAIDATDGNFDLDIIGGQGTSCQKDAEEWINLGGSAKKINKKPEYFVKGPPEKQTQTQQGS